jgi:hypothetical protein
MIFRKRKTKIELDEDFVLFRQKNIFCLPSLSSSQVVVKKYDFYCKLSANNNIYLLHPLPQTPKSQERVWKATEASFINTTSMFCLT